MNKEAIIKATKEFFRVIVLAIIPVAISAIEKGEFNYRVFLIVGALAGLRWLDKLLHELGKAQGENSALIKGLTRF